MGVQRYSFIKHAAFLLLAVTAMLPKPGAAQVINAISCTDSDASVTSTSPVVVIATCAVTAGPQGVIVANAQATTTCGTTATETVQMFGGLAGGSSTIPVDGSAVPSSMSAMTPLLHQNGCNGVTLITKLTGSMIGTPGLLYYVTIAVSTNTGAQAATWTNQTIKVLTY